MDNCDLSVPLFFMGLGTTLLLPTLTVNRAIRAVLIVLALLSFASAVLTYHVPAPLWLRTMASNPAIWVILFLSMLTIGVGWPVVREHLAFLRVMKNAKEQIVGRYYRNEIVKVDGKQFVKCTFENVTFQFDGTALSSMVDCTQSGTNSYGTANPIIKNWNEMLLEMKALSPSVRLRNPS